MILLCDFLSYERYFLLKNVSIMVSLKAVQHVTSK